MLFKIPAFGNRPIKEPCTNLINCNVQNIGSAKNNFIQKLKTNRVNNSRTKTNPYMPDYYKPEFYKNTPGK